MHLFPTHPSNGHTSRAFTQNLQHHLWDRESGINRWNLRSLPLPWHLAYERELHKSITPNLTVQNVDKPLGYMRKFTPDGRLLLAFSHDQRSLEVYQYRGVCQAASLLQQQRGECITAADHSLDSLHVRQQVYGRLLKLRWSIRITVPDASVRLHLNREFSIFLQQGRYVLLAAMSPTTTLPSFEYLRFPDLYDDTDLFAYNFFLIDLQRGCICDVLHYDHDCIMLSHNHGVSVHDCTIALLSNYRQSIDLFELSAEGRLCRLYTIGTFGCDLDRELEMAVPEYRTADLAVDGELPLSHLKQCILSFVYRQIMEIGCPATRRLKLAEFYKNFGIYERMIMQKMQLIDGDHLLIRYEERPSQMPMESFMGSSNKTDFKLYVFYCISSQRVLKVFPKNSIELLYILRNFCDNFRNVCSLQTQRPSSSPSNNMYFRAAFNSAITSIHGGQTEAALRFNPTLPISSQSFATSPYLDFSLFNYDDRLISALERPKISSLEPIRFSDRNTNITKFRLFLEPPSGIPANGAIASNASSNHRELVAFIFHPYEPFIISIQKLSTRYVVNFHIYNESTVVSR